MREIKFRCFYRDKMYQVEELSFYGDDDSCSVNLIGIDIDGAAIGVNPDDEHVKGIMQYTGLKDKNGKEIYEGDIVSVEWGGMEDEYVIRELGNPFVIEFRDYGWFPFDKYLPTPECIKVIGNIHENPELK